MEARSDTRPSARSLSAARRRSDPRRPARRGDGGITLLEFMVAFSLFTVILLGMSAFLVAITRQVDLNREYAVANEWVSNTLSTIQVTPFDRLQLPGVGFPDGSEIPVPDLPQGRIRVEYEDPTSDPLEVSVAISWESVAAGRVERVFRTIRTR